jgi:hypothetical protein
VRPLEEVGVLARQQDRVAAQEVTVGEDDRLAEIRFALRARRSRHQFLSQCP